MKIVAGLGNPGAQYAGTPHSIGFDVLDLVASRCGAVWEEKPRFKCLLAKAVVAGVPALLVKPLTFMNLSGESIAPIVKYHNATPQDLLVVHDDIDMSTGRIRIRTGGSCGGHNGVRNIIERLGSSSFTRLKLGVGKNRANVVGHVLGKFSPESRRIMSIAAEKAADAVTAILRDGADKAMNTYNGFDAAAVAAAGDDS